MSINKLLLRVYIFSHNFLVTDIGARGRELCFSFSKDLVQYAWENVAGQYHRVPTKVFASATQDRSQFRFHINLFENFESFLLRNDIKGDLVEFIKVPVSEGVDVEFVVKPNWVARPDQLPVVDYLYKEEPVSKFVDLQTGKGKSFLAMLAIANRAKRVCIIVKPMYIKKWVQDFCKTYEIHPSEILVIQGSASLMALLEMAKNGTLDCKAIILSNKTMQNWLSAYQEHKDDTLEAGYACRPHSFFEFVGVGLRLIDEVHQDFHLYFKIDLNTNVTESISLSATLLSNDPFIEKMYEIAYPLANRFRGLALDKYIDSYAMHYRFKDPIKIRTCEYGQKKYSHMCFEKSIMRHVPTLRNYIDLIGHAIQIGYLDCQREKKKLAVFASSVEMCTQLTKHFSDKYPNLSVKRYVHDDPMENLLDADIRFTTIMSGGTAHDIPDLTTVILTIAIDSVQANVQAFGRLRKLPDSDVQFYYFVCDDIPKHAQYHERKVQMLEKRAKSFREIFTGKYV